MSKSLHQLHCFLLKFKKLWPFSFLGIKSDTKTKSFIHIRLNARDHLATSPPHRRRTDTERKQQKQLNELWNTVETGSEPLLFTSLSVRGHSSPLSLRKHGFKCVSTIARYSAINFLCSSCQRVAHPWPHPSMIVRLNRPWSQHGLWAFTFCYWLTFIPTNDFHSSR